MPLLLPMSLELGQFAKSIEVATQPLACGKISQMTWLVLAFGHTQLRRQPVTPQWEHVS